MVEKKIEEPRLARDEILNRIRNAVGIRKLERESDYAYIPRQYEAVGKRDHAGCISLFIDRVCDYGASVLECEEASLSETISVALRERNATKILTGKDFPGRWIPIGFNFHGDYALEYDEIDGFDAVVTPCALAIAETGTIILRHADDEPRRAVSLIPDYHLCIVFSAQIVETVPEGVRQMAAMGNVPLTTISGPSATSDIEMTRIKGVHGPRTLDVILVHNSD